MLSLEESTQAEPVQIDEIEPSERPALRRFRSWRRFHYGPRRSNRPLLAGLERYPDAVLVAGCQRSGTTMLTRIIASSDGFRPLALTHDDELDAALVLHESVHLPSGQRYCFQTTYVNERYAEYRHLGIGQRLIWVIRNPYSVVYSMVHNWRRFALRELFNSCGREVALGSGVRWPGQPWPVGPSLMERACFAYAGKTAQIETIRALVPASRLMIVDYDALVCDPQNQLPTIFRFVGEPYHEAYGNVVRSDTAKKADQMSRSARRFVKQIAEPVYRRCVALATNPAPNA